MLLTPFETAFRARKFGPGAVTGGLGRVAHATVRAGRKAANIDNLMRVVFSAGAAFLKGHPRTARPTSARRRMDEQRIALDAAGEAALLARGQYRAGLSFGTAEPGKRLAKQSFC